MKRNLIRYLSEAATAFISRQSPAPGRKKSPRQLPDKISVPAQPRHPLHGRSDRLPRRGDLLPNGKDFLPNGSNLLPHRNDCLPNRRCFLPKGGDFLPMRIGLLPNGRPPLPRRSEPLPYGRDRGQQWSDRLPYECDLPRRKRFLHRHGTERTRQRPAGLRHVPGRDNCFRHKGLVGCVGRKARYGNFFVRELVGVSL